MGILWPYGAQSGLTPYDRHVGVFLDDLVEGRQVDTGDAADLVGAVAAGEEAPDAHSVLQAGVVPVRAAGVAEVHRVPGAEKPVMSIYVSTRMLSCLGRGKWAVDSVHIQTHFGRLCRILVALYV